MKNLKELFKQIGKIKDLAQKRAHEYMMASGENRSHYEAEFYTNGRVTFSDDKVHVNFREATSHDMPQYKMISLSTEHLEMSNEEWDKYIEELEAERDQRDREKEEKKKKRKLEQLSKELKEKDDEYKRLIRELGK